MAYLTKSDFKACFECRTKLYYRKNGYPSALAENDYLRFLADGGFMIEHVAKTRFPDGVDSFAATKSLLARDKVTIFEAAATVGGFHVRTDILQREGATLNLIEVKSSSLEDDEDDGSSPFLTGKGTVKSRWRSYLLDLAFQVFVLRQAFGDFAINPVLCVVNKGVQVTEAETLGRFSLRKTGGDKARPDITYLGDPADLTRSRLLTLRSVATEVGLLMPEVEKRAGELLALLGPAGSGRVQEEISEFYRECRVCEFRTVAEGRSGFSECWQDLALVSPHILDLYRVGQLAGKGKPDPVAIHLKKREASYLNLEPAELGDGAGFSARRLLQWHAMREGGREVLPEALRTALLEHQTNPGWPLYFVDFEACDISLPHHAGLHPYERVAFQWSCHTMAEDGRVTHREWLNTERRMPNFAFVRSLAECLGTTGTVYVWSPYEQVTLKKVARQIVDWMQRDEPSAVELAGAADASELLGLVAWIEALLGPEDAKGKRVSPRIRDLHKFALEHYFHPLMAGRTSIKVVLPSVWQSDEHIRQHPCFRQYLKLDAGGRPLDPYKALPALPFGDDEEEDEAVREGTGAIRVYQDLLFADSPSAEDTARRRKLLLQYCGLDTAAMVMIWMHWLGRYDVRPA